LLHGYRRSYRGIAAIVGSVVLIAIFIASATFIIITLERFGSLAKEMANHITERNDRQLVLYGVESTWSFNGTDTAIYIDNKMGRTVLLTAIAVVYSDGSYEIVSSYNKTVDIYVSTHYMEEQHRIALNLLQLPYPLPPATRTVVYIGSIKTPIAVSIALAISTTSIAIPSRQLEISMK